MRICISSYSVVAWAWRGSIRVHNILHVILNAPFRRNRISMTSRHEPDRSVIFSCFSITCHLMSRRWLLHSCVKLSFAWSRLFEFLFNGYHNDGFVVDQRVPIFCKGYALSREARPDSSIMTVQHPPPVEHVVANA